MDLRQQISSAYSVGRCFVPASAYSFEELADIYNRTRVDYIVPMPMNSKRMAEYVHLYDVDLGLSLVSLDTDRSPTGLIMIGVRNDHAWITRLGILPEKRRNRLGQDLMETSINRLRENGIRRVQLEVIKGNAPAHQLFLKLGFVECRELLVIRRPPRPVTTALLPEGATVSPLESSAIMKCLETRETHIAWTEETASLTNISALKGFCIDLPSGETGWLIYQFSTFELTHIVLSPGASTTMMDALICQLHKQHPMHDTKIENIPREHSAWQVFQKFDYLEVFSRIEMYKDFGAIS